MRKLCIQSALRQCKTALLATMFTAGLAYGDNAFAAEASASPGDGQLAMTTGVGPAYSVVKLGSAYVACMNALGQVAFSIGINWNSTAYFYDGTQFQIYSYATPYAMNDNGQVVGYNPVLSRDASLPPKTSTNWIRGPSLASSCYSKRRPPFNTVQQLPGNYVVAVGTDGGQSYAFLWTPSTKAVVNLGTLDGESIDPWAINNAGQVIGGTSNGGRWGKGFIWSAADGMIGLGTTPDMHAAPYAINDAGQVVGGALVPHTRSFAFLWTKTGGMVNLSGPIGKLGSLATAINNKGQVVGVSEGKTFSWTQAGGMVYIGAAVDFSSLAINDLGQVMTPSFIWTSAGGRVDVGSLGSGNTTAAGINNLGQVVGSTNNQSGQTRAFVWTSAGGMVDLNTPGLPVDTPLQNATAIADNGSILATSSGGVTYLLIPNTRRITSPPAGSFFQMSPFQRLTPGKLIFP